MMLSKRGSSLAFGLVFFWLCFCTLALGPTLAHAEVVIRNTPNGTDGGSTLDNSNWKALLFSTNAYSARINAIEVGLNPPGNVPPSMSALSLPAQLKVELMLYTMVGGLPATQIASTGLQQFSMSQRRQMYSFAFPSTVRLEPNTAYAMVLRSDVTGIKWGNQNTSAQGGTSPTALAGYTYLGFAETLDAGTSWSSNDVNTLNAVSIDVSFLDVPIPSLSQWSMILLACLMGAAALWFRARQTKWR